MSATLDQFQESLAANQEVGLRRQAILDDAQAQASAGNQEFIPFPKISRLNRPIIVTEKIDGTNAAVGVTEDGVVYAQSRKKLITPGKQTDNAGFAGWVQEHEDELREGLGVGLHFGEWWGAAIQRKYDLDEKRFSLFNTSRWTDDVRPTCCHVVPVLLEAERFETELVDAAMQVLGETGSVAAPGFMDPEGVVVFHPHSNSLFKATFQSDDTGKEHGA